MALQRFPPPCQPAYVTNLVSSVACEPSLVTDRAVVVVQFAMATKRKRVVLSVSDKLKITDQLKNGASGSHLAREYGVGNATISDIKKNSDAITKFASVLDSEDESLHRKTMKMAEKQDLDTAVYKWFM